LYTVKTKKVNIWHLENAVPEEDLADREKCIRQLVQIAVKNAKFRSSHLETDRFIVEIAGRNTRNTKFSAFSGL
jgi:hypothetical protein